MPLYSIKYKVEERSTMQAIVEASSPDEALAELRVLADEVGGYGDVGAWLSTEDTIPDLESFVVEEMLQ